jgi:hypothetical protein
MSQNHTPRYVRDLVELDYYQREMLHFLRGIHTAVWVLIGVVFFFPAVVILAAMTGL